MVASGGGKIDIKKQVRDGRSACGPTPNLQLQAWPLCSAADGLAVRTITAHGHTAAVRPFACAGPEHH